VAVWLSGNALVLIEEVTTPGPVSSGMGDPCPGFTYLSI